MADISQVSVNEVIYDIKDKTARTQIDDIKADLESLNGDSETVPMMLRKTSSGAVVISGSTITITETLEDGDTCVVVLYLNDEDYPEKITVDGHEIPWTWSVF